MVGALIDVVRVLVVVGAWALAHHAARHLVELTDLGWQRAAEPVGAQILGSGGERTKHESVQRRVLMIERDDERECTALRHVSLLGTMMVMEEMCGYV